MRNPAAQPSIGAALLAALGHYHSTKVAAQQWQRYEHENLQKRADKDPKHAEWVHKAQQRLLVLTENQAAADRLVALLLDEIRMPALEATAQDDAYARRSITAPLVIQWLEYEATDEEIRAVINYLSDFREKVRLVQQFTLDELRARLQPNTDK